MAPSIGIQIGQDLGAGRPGSRSPELGGARRAAREIDASEIHSGHLQMRYGRGGPTDRIGVAAFVKCSFTPGATLLHVARPHPRRNYGAIDCVLGAYRNFLRSPV